MFSTTGGGPCRISTGFGSKGKFLDTTACSESKLVKAPKSFSILPVVGM